jgi:hypothetical protein
MPFALVTAPGTVDRGRVVIVTLLLRTMRLLLRC